MLSECLTKRRCVLVFRFSRYRSRTWSSCQTDTITRTRLSLIDESLANEAVGLYQHEMGSLDFPKVVSFSQSAQPHSGLSPCGTVNSSLSQTGVDLVKTTERSVRMISDTVIFVSLYRTHQGDVYFRFNPNSTCTEPDIDTLMTEKEARSLGLHHHQLLLNGNSSCTAPSCGGNCLIVRLQSWITHRTNEWPPMFILQRRPMKKMLLSTMMRAGDESSN